MSYTQPSPHPLDFNMSVIFSSKNIIRGHKLKLTYLHSCWIMYIRHHLQNMKTERKGWPEIRLILGRCGTQYVAMGIKLLSPNCRARLVESYCKE